MNKFLKRRRIFALCAAVVFLFTSCAGDVQGGSEGTTASYTSADEKTEQTTALTTAETTAFETVSATEAETSETTTTGTSTEISEISDENAIPVIYISTKNGAAILSKDEYTEAKLVINGCESGFDSLAETSCGIKGRGHSTWLWDKKPYKIKLDKAASIFGMAKAKDWILLANYADKSLMRNYVASAMGTALSGISFTTSQIFAEVYLNGEYQGVYTVCEQIEVKEGRVSIDKEYDVDDTGYLIEVHGVDPATDVYGRDYFSTKLVYEARIKSPDTEKLSESQFSYIKKYVKSTEKAIMTLDGYEDYIDVDSFIDWQILHELTYNMDSAFRRSCFLTKPKGGKLQMGPIWDFDLAFGNFCEDSHSYDDWVTAGLFNSDCIGLDKLSEVDIDATTYDDYYILINWYNYLMSDSAYVKKLTKRWNEVKDTLLETAFSAIDDGATLLGDAQLRNFSRWNCLSTRVGYESGATLAYPTFNGQLDYLKNFLQKRFNWIDAQLN